MQLHPETSASQPFRVEESVPVWPRIRPWLVAAILILAFAIQWHLGKKEMLPKPSDQEVERQILGRDPYR